MIPLMSSRLARIKPAAFVFQQALERGGAWTERGLSWPGVAVLSISSTAHEPWQITWYSRSKSHSELERFILPSDLSSSECLALYIIREELKSQCSLSTSTVLPRALIHLPQWAVRGGMRPGILYALFHFKCRYSLAFSVPEDLTVGGGRKKNKPKTVLDTAA